MKTACVLDREHSNKEATTVMVNAKTHAKYQKSENQQFLAKLQMRRLCSPDINTLTDIRTLRTPHSFARRCPSSSRNLGNQVAHPECKTQEAEAAPAVRELASEREPQLKPAASYLAAAEDICQGHLNVEVLQNLHGLFFRLF